jgi:hypothetical protein
MYLMAQKNVLPAGDSEFTGLTFSKEVLKDERSFFVDVAKTTLELESGTGTISALEVFSWPNENKQKIDAEEWLISVIQNLDSSGWKLQTSVRDHSYMYLKKDGQNLLMYILQGKKEANLYFGKLNDSTVFNLKRVDEEVKNDPQQDDTSSAPSITSEIVGSWGNLMGSKINYYDDATGVMVGSGLSKGGGYEFNADGSYSQSFLATSSRPTYKIFVYTKGTYKVFGNNLTLTPTDRHYRKWEYEQLVTEEHSKPALENHQWVIRPNQYTGKACLYIMIKGEQSEREYCKE